MKNTRPLFNRGRQRLKEIKITINRLLIAASSYENFSFDLLLKSLEIVNFLTRARTRKKKEIQTNEKENWSVVVLFLLIDSNPRVKDRVVSVKNGCQVIQFITRKASLCLISFLVQLRVKDLPKYKRNRNASTATALFMILARENFQFFFRSLFVYELIAQLNIYQMFHVQTPHEIYVPVFLTNSQTRIKTLFFFSSKIAQKKVKNVFIKKVKMAKRDKFLIIMQVKTSQTWSDSNKWNEVWTRGSLIN